MKILLSAIVGLLLVGCPKEEPKYYVNGKQVEPALEWCGTDEKNCFMSVNPIINGVSDKTKRFVVPKSQVVEKK